jgi:hypothetical protein
MLCDMSHITCAKKFRFEVAKLPPQMPCLPTEGLTEPHVRTRGWCGPGKAGPGRPKAKLQPCSGRGHGGLPAT